MSQARETMLDQLIHYFFQNLSTDIQTSEDEEKGLSHAQELRIEVSLIFYLIFI